MLRRLFHDILRNAGDNPRHDLQDVTVRRVLHTPDRAIMRAHFADPRHDWQQIIVPRGAWQSHNDVIVVPRHYWRRLYARMLEDYCVDWRRRSVHQRLMIDATPRDREILLREMYMQDMREFEERAFRGVDPGAMTNQVAPDEPTRPLCVEDIYAAMECMVRPAHRLVPAGGPNGAGSDKARQRGEALLKENLRPEQLEAYERTGTFDAIGCHTGRRYRIDKNENFNVQLIDARDKILARLCFQPGEPLVTGDRMLAQKIALENDERDALDVANAVTIGANGDVEQRGYAHHLLGPY